MPYDKITMHKRHTNEFGFTIVELLIVIVVISILVAICVSAYTGVQNRAYNSKVVAGTQQYVKAFIAYKSVNGDYPAAIGCLGKNYPNNACWAGAADGTGTLGLPINSSLDTALNEFVPSTSKPEFDTTLTYLWPSSYRAGLAYLSNFYGYGYSMRYYLKGNSDCVLQVAARSVQSQLTECVISLP